MRFFFLFILCYSLSALAEEKITLKGLFKNQAIIKIGDKYQVIKKGKISKNGIYLVSITAKKAIIKLNDQQITLELNHNNPIRNAVRKTVINKKIKIVKKPPNYKPLIIKSNFLQNGHFLVKGEINNTPITFLVDTGASSVSISRKFARQAGIKFNSYNVGASQTANGRAKYYKAIAPQIKVGHIELYNIEVAILPKLEGNALLGMNFLKHTKFSVENNQMVITRKRGY